MDQVLIYRIISFGLATAYLLEQMFGFGHGLYTGDLGEGFGWQFRYLTIWALIAHVLLGYGLLISSIDKNYKVNDGLVAMAAALGLYVVIMYWGLFFIDPELVNGNHNPVWLREYYLHLVGPLILWIDAVFIKKALEKLWQMIKFNIIICISYCFWIELAIKPLNSKPIGDVTNGLPYPFLNDMSLSERIIFYLLSIAVGILPMLISRQLGRFTFGHKSKKY